MYNGYLGNCKLCRYQSDEMDDLVRHVDKEHEYNFYPSYLVTTYGIGIGILALEFLKHIDKKECSRDNETKPM